LDQRRKLAGQHAERSHHANGALFGRRVKVLRKPPAAPFPQESPESQPPSLHLPADLQMMLHFERMPQSWRTGGSPARARSTVQALFLVGALLSFACTASAAHIDEQLWRPAREPGDDRDERDDASESPEADRAASSPYGPVGVGQGSAGDRLARAIERLLEPSEEADVNLQRESSADGRSDTSDDPSLDALDEAGESTHVRVPRSNHRHHGHRPVNQPRSDADRDYERQQQQRGPAYGFGDRHGAAAVATGQPKALSPLSKSMLQEIADSAPDRLTEVWKRLRDIGISPDKTYKIVQLTHPSTLKFARKEVTLRADELVIENRRIINWLRLRGKIPAELNGIDINEINDLHTKDMDAYIQNVPAFVTIEIMHAMRALGFHSHDRTMVYSIRINGKSKFDAVFSHMDSKKAYAFQIASNGGHSRWVLLALDRKEGAVKDFGDQNEALMRWVGRKANREHVFGTNEVAEFEWGTHGRSSVYLEQQDEGTLQSAVSDCVTEIVKARMERERTRKFHQTPAEGMVDDLKTNLEHSLIPGAEEKDDIKNGQWDLVVGKAEINAIGAEFPGAGEAAGAAKEALVEGERFAERTAVKSFVKGEENALARNLDAEVPAYKFGPGSRFMKQGKVPQQGAGTRAGGEAAEEGVVIKAAERDASGRECIVRYSVGRGKRGAECIAYWHPSAPVGSEVAPHVEQKISDLKSLVASDSALISYIGQPAGKTLAALERTMMIAREAGYDTKAIGVGLFYDLQGATIGSHFATIIETDGMEIVVDPMAHGMSGSAFSGPFVGTKEQWLRVFTSSERRQPVVAYKVSADSDLIRREFEPGRLAQIDLLNVPPDMTIRTSAKWFERARSNPRAVDALKRQEGLALVRWRKKLQERRENEALTGQNDIARVMRLPARIESLANTLISSNESDLAKRLAHGGVCWDAVINFQAEVKAITESEASHLHTVTRGHNFGEFLKDSRQIATPAEFAKVRAGERIGFVGIRDGALKHAMLSVGDGRAIGVNNGFLDPKFNPGWASIDLTRELTWNGGLVYSADGGVALRVVVGTSGVVG
jgi:hypothetical protein